jgi:hypothetical protein
MDKLIQFRGGTKVHNDKKTVDLFRALDPTTSPNALIELSDSNDPRILRLLPSIRIPRALLLESY